MPALTLSILPFWLFSIDERRVGAEARQKVITSQRVYIKVLAEHFANKVQAHSESQAVVPAEPSAHPEKPAPDADDLAWASYYEEMAAWHRWRADLEQWRQNSEQQSKALEQRQETLENRQDTLEGRIEGVEELSRLFIEVTERLGPQTLTPAHQARDKELGVRLHDLTGIAFATIYGELNKAFRVGAYRDIPDASWEQVAAWFQTRITAAERRRHF